MSKASRVWAAMKRVLRHQKKATESKSSAKQFKDLGFFPRFYDLPLEIQREIIRWGLLAHSLPPYFGWPNNGSPLWKPIGLKPAGIRRPLRGSSRFWGTRTMTTILPVSRQWYSEIEDVLYSTFTFEIYTTLLELGRT